MGFLVTFVQYPIVVGLSLALWRAATEIEGDTGRSFLWVDDLSQSPLDVCCPEGGSLPSGIADLYLGPGGDKLGRPAPERERQR